MMSAQHSGQVTAGVVGHGVGKVGVTHGSLVARDQDNNWVRQYLNQHDEKMAKHDTKYENMGRHIKWIKNTSGSSLDCS
ncbi:hypothetical protein ElyMa_004079200 [Elysia marginata]|uniref:Uncharacterized protein n=1 Tax=Elysia marginata TaxID=1093978 RepID=A0AAV4G7T5_9GAST|nr:hypothetical protein ElyMa_004079200 [Elysia marginata]